MKRILLTLPLMAAFSLVAPRFAGAATFNVTKIQDTNDGTCDGDCSLREAVVAANATDPAPDAFNTINVPPGNYVITNGNADFDIAAHSLVIQKQGASDQIVNIDATGINDRIFDVSTDNVNLTLKGINLSNSDLNGTGGCIRFSVNGVTLELEDVKLSNCKGTSGGAIDINNGGGNGVANLNLKNVIFSGNKANSGNGGAINAADTNVTLNAVSFIGNTASANGGGLFVGTGDVNILNSTFGKNNADDGAGIYLKSGNGNSDDLIAQIGFTTITENVAQTDMKSGGVVVEKGGNNSANLTFTGSIVYGNSFANMNTPSNCAVINSGVINTTGFNVYENKMECNGGNNDIQQDPQLGFLDGVAVYGIGEGGAADGAVPVAECSFDNNDITVDQIGNVRPAGLDGNCDAGAYELPICGDGVKSIDEDCDDGNVDNTDACLNTCGLASCGDGFVQAGVEECDDGNLINGDGCDNACKLEVAPPVCGNGSIETGEQCDDSNLINGDGCSSTCQDEAPLNCGDGNLDANEQCDDGNLVDGDGCSSVCKSELNGGGGCSLGSTNSPVAGAGLLALIVAMGALAMQRRSKQS